MSENGDSQELTPAQATALSFDATPPALRALSSALVSRADFAKLAGYTFRGKRDLYDALGYQRLLKPIDYRERYARGGIAQRIVEAFPKSTWRGGIEVVEDEDPTIETEFEKAFTELNTRLNVWGMCEKVDILASLGRYAVLFLGAPGETSEPLERSSLDDLKYLAGFSERDITVEKLEPDIENERYALPTHYSLKRVSAATTGNIAQNTLRVHYSRVIHVAEGILDDPLVGKPRLESVWNYLDDLEKVVGGGAEAFWKRSDQGLQVNISPDVSPTKEEKQALKEEIDDYIHLQKRVLTTRGVELNSLGSDVAQFHHNAGVILDLISSTTGIPKRILMGSERGELASTTDKSNYDDRVTDRRNEFAGPQIARPLVDRLIQIGVLPEAEYEIRWPEIANVTDEQRMDMATKAALVNRTHGGTVITEEEIRDRILGYPPLEEVDVDPVLDGDE